MYLPEAFAERDPTRLARFIAEFPLGLLVTPRRTGAAAGAQLHATPEANADLDVEANADLGAEANADLDVDANLLPFEHLPPTTGSPATDSPATDSPETGGGVLRAHVARANPLWRACDGASVLVVFHGPQAYVSPGWYPGKAEHGKVVPTWNYTMVQARGTLRVRDDVDWLRAQVTRLTAIHEASFAAPWAPDDAPAEYVDALLRAVVGIEIQLHSLVGKWKLSQNRMPADQRGVAEAMHARAQVTRGDVTQGDVARGDVPPGDVVNPFAWLAAAMASDG